MTQEQRTSYWQDLINTHSRSRLSVTEFCRDQQINRQSFCRWRQRVKSESTSPATGAFLELVPSSKHGESGVRLRMDQDIAIELDCAFDPSTLRQVISMLRVQSCLP